MDSLLDTEELLALLLARIKKGEALLQSEIDILMSIGKFLSLWDCSTGLPATNPPGGVPYTYKTGDYYRVKTVDEDTNYKPSGLQYTGEASTDIETDDVIQYATYFFDGAEWILLNAPSKDVYVLEVTSLSNIDVDKFMSLVEHYNNNDTVYIRINNSSTEHTRLIILISLDKFRRLLEGSTKKYEYTLNFLEATYSHNTSDISFSITSLIYDELDSPDHIIVSTKNSLSYVDKTTTVNGHALFSNVTVSKSDVGLGNVDNTSDDDKPISSATQTALSGKLNIMQGNNIVYVNRNGSPSSLAFSSEATTSYSVAVRDSNGAILVGTPTAASHAVTKSYADALVENTVTYSGTTTAGSFSDTIIVQGS